ncbi:LysR family transcriptional regulator [Saccharopolyspora mangrovi]|uniref:LysR substrate-binding domain-containing protein n=1 Tax=Saccharopolyspora mangrovi TaxID=3082379 RepID=A0ABU6ABK4_9PSEU|nr:LysR substrate-binding domain-containing protein [Saccharopolyspora sp. S2-29]MEB3368851.1 LysR substrate-binding domain-containing protein [Saccharopolyspora sp. S2-29]
MLDVRRMQVLRAVVTSGSVSAAASNLGFTPSAISQQLSTLEKEAGTPLLEKAGRGLRPTPAGTLLAERAGRISELLNETEAELADIRAGRTGLLRLRFFTTAAVGLIPQAVAKFRAEHPEVQLDLQLQEEGLLEDVASGETDLAVIVVGESVPQRRGVRLVHLADDPYRVVLPGSHPQVDQDSVDMAKLAHDSWVNSAVTDGGICSRLLRDAYASAGFTPRVAVETDSTYSAQGFVAAGMGIALVPRLGLDVVHPGVEVRAVTNPEPTRRLYVAARDAVADLPATRSLLECLQETAKTA